MLKWRILPFLLFMPQDARAPKIGIALQLVGPSRPPLSACRLTNPVSQIAPGQGLCLTLLFYLVDF